jgi:hypothetical protein
MARFQVVQGSESGHCCFDATVVDTQSPHSAFKDSPDWVCECFELEDAEKICAALNAAEEVSDVNPDRS